MRIVSHLSKDGHVTWWVGANPPRRYVSRQKLCLRGTTVYWINDALGRPFFVIFKAITKTSPHPVRRPP